MRRISAENFCKGNWEDDVTAIRIKDGEFYGLADVFDDAGLKIFVPECPVLLDRDLVVVFGNLNMTEVRNHGTILTSEFVADEDCTIYDCLLDYIQPYTRNGVSDEDDYDIFIMTANEISAISDALRDGDYIIIKNMEE